MKVALISGKKIVEVSPCYFRPTEVDLLIGEAQAKEQPGWEARTDIGKLKRIMEHGSRMVKKH